jgi:hypothetical protein
MRASVQALLSMHVSEHVPPAQVICACVQAFVPSQRTLHA